MPLSQVSPLQETETFCWGCGSDVDSRGSKAESPAATNPRTSQRPENIMTRQDRLAERSSELFVGKQGSDLI